MTPSLKLTVDPIPGSAVAQAHDAYLVRDAAQRSCLSTSFAHVHQAAFPQLGLSETTLVLLTATDGSSLTNSTAARAVAARLASFALPYVGGLLSAESGVSYWSFMDAGIPALAAPLLSPGGEAALVSFVSTEGAVLSARFTKFLTALRAEVDSAVGDAGGINGQVTGGLVLTADSGAAILGEVGASDGVTVTLSFLILACAIRSLRLIAVALSALIVAFGFAFIFLWPLTTALRVPNFTTSLLTSTLISLSLDYSLFLLKAVKASLAAGVPMLRAVEDMLRTAGHTVLVSGATLSAVFLVLATFPISIVRAPGIATTFAVVGSVLAGLTFTPALLLAFPRTWHQPHHETQGALWPRRAAALRRMDLAGLRLWWTLAHHTRTYAVATVAIVMVLLVVPFAVRLPSFAVSQKLTNIVPRGEPSIVALNKLRGYFGLGTDYTPILLGTINGGAGGPSSVLTPAFFSSATSVINTLILASGPSVLTAALVTGLPWTPAGPSNPLAIAAAVAASAACPADSAAACRAVCPADACLVRLISAASVSADQQALSMTLQAQVDLATPAGLAWMRMVRSLLVAQSASNGGAVTWRLKEESGAETVSYIFDNFGRLIGITAAVVFALLAISFRSLAISLRSVASLAVMLTCVFGAATYIYSENRLPAGAENTFSGDQGLFWLMPIIAFSLCTGLGLDYDIFLLTSVCEDREAGWGDADSVSVALQRSGPVISWAGMIMSVAYGGFLFSDVPLLNQLGMYIVFAVLVDTFIVRPLLVPSVMHLIGPANWWPRRMPEPSRAALDFSQLPEWDALQADLSVAPEKGAEEDPPPEKPPAEVALV